MKNDKHDVFINGLFIQTVIADNDAQIIEHFAARGVFNPDVDAIAIKPHEIAKPDGCVIDMLQRGVELCNASQEFSKKHGFTVQRMRYYRMEKTA